jgi:ABC-type phosphate transport system substrate-binding protein
MRLTALLFALCGAWLAAGACAAAGLAVVVSAHSPVTTLRQDQVAAIFLGQSARFPDGAEAFALDLPLGSPLRDQFYLRVTGKTPALLKAHWSKMVFTGRGRPPGDLPDSVAVRHAVAENTALVGYIDRDALDPSVRAVLVVY